MQIFRLATACMKIHQILYVIFGNKSQFFFKLCIPLQCHETLLFCTFSSKSLYALDKSIRSKCKFSDFRLFTWKLTKFFMLFFKPLVSFPLIFVTPLSVMTQSLWNFLTETLYALDKKSPSVYNFAEFWVL